MRRFDSHEVPAYASLYLSSLAECVFQRLCVCVRVFSLLGVWRAVECMLMWIGRGPRDQAEDDNPGCTLCGPANSLTDGRREKGQGGRERESRKEGHHPPDFCLLHFRSAFRWSSSQHETSFCEYWFPFRQQLCSLICLPRVLSRQNAWCSFAFFCILYFTWTRFGWCASRKEKSSSFEPCA